MLDRLQDKPDVETNLRQIRKRRINERGNVVYIPPQAKASLHASDDSRFSLMDRVNEYLKSDQTVLLILGDSGSGKSTFNRSLEFDLWQAYNAKTGIIPLYINLPAIDKPEHDLVAKQLRKLDFTEAQIRELKYRHFILICDGYDESQQTHNLYTSNRLNEEGEWVAKMVISCRSEYVGRDYRDRFEPGNRNLRSGRNLLFDEAVISPFSADQVQEYIRQYVDLHRPLWEMENYTQALDFIPGLKDLVKNPFLLTLSLEVLPRMMDPGQQVSAARITKVALYDQFVEQWLERGKKRLGEKSLSFQARSAFDSLCDEGFTVNGIDYLKRLSVAIYKEQGGQPVVEYSRLNDEGTWKAAFFRRNEENQLLREACPLVRNGTQYRFIHRSLLEYGLARAVHDPQLNEKKAISESILTRRGSASSIWSFEVEGGLKDVITSVTKKQPVDPDSPLVWRSFVKETSIIQFLSERAQQEPVFKQQLLDYIGHSKAEKRWRIAAANAITILIKAGVQFINGDLRGIQIPGADLGNGMFESARLQGADLRQVKLHGAWLRRTDLSGARMDAVQFGELPFLKENANVRWCAYSPDGKSLTLGLSNGDIRVYSTVSWELAQTLSGHMKEINSIAYSPTGDQIMSGSGDHTVRLWDADAGVCRCILSGHDDEVNMVAFAPCGRLGASASSDETVRVWDLRTGECRHVLTGHEGFIAGVAYSPKGNLVASGGDGDYAVRLWDVQTGACLHTLSEHTDTVWAIAFSSQGDWIVSGSADKTLRIWDVETGTCCRVLTGHRQIVRSIAFSPKGDLIASSSNDKTVRIWDAETGVCCQILPGHSGIVGCVVFSPGGDRIACGNEDKTVKIWDVGSGEARQIASGHGGTVFSVKYSPRGGQVVTCSNDGSIRLWDMETGYCHRALTGHGGEGIAHSPQGNLVASGSRDGTVRIWDVETGVCRHTFTGLNSPVGAIAYSPQGDQVASGCFESLTIWDVRTGECRHTPYHYTQRMTAIIYSPKGNQLASINFDDTIRLWDVESGVCLYTLDGHEKGASKLVYSPQGDLLASASYDSTVRLWDVETGECRHVLTGHTEAVRIVVYSPQGGRVVSGSWDESLKIWDDGTGECLHTLVGHTGDIRSVVFSPNGDQIVSGSEDKTIRLWNVTSGQCQYVIQDLDAFVQSMAWSTIPSVNSFIIGCDDGSVLMWKVVEDEDAYCVRLHWKTVSGELNVKDTLIQDAHGLSQLNKQLLMQRRAVGKPSHTRPPM